MKLASLKFLLAAGALLATVSTATAAPTPANITAAVSDSGRPAADVGLDAERKPAELLAFVGVKSGMTVVDVFPGPYWDKIFSKAVGASGKVYMYFPQEIVKAENIKAPPSGSQPFQDYPNVTAVVAPANSFAVPTAADVVWIRQNYHDLYDKFMGPADVPAFNKAVFKALKPGGVYVVIDHSAPDGSGLSAADTTHRIDSAVVKKDMAAAGFVFVGESDALRNPSDTRDKLVFDKAIRGHTDQFVYLFRKP